MKNIVIEYLDNGQWKTYPNNHHLHSDVYKKTIIPLDMEIIKENKIRLYQRSIYVFDYIAIDYSLDEIYSVEYFKPINQEQLEDADDSEILMELDDFIELNFPKVEGDSFFLMSKGYYLPGKNKGDVE